MADATGTIRLLLEEAQKTIGGIDDVDKAVKRLDKDLRRLRNAGKIDTATFVKAQKQLASVRKEAKRAGTSLGRLKNSAKGIRTVTSAFGGLRAAIAALGIGLVIRKLVEFVKAGIDVKNAFDSVENTIRAVTDSTDEFERAQALIFRTSRRLGLQIVNVGKNYAQLVAATKEVDLSTRQVEDVFLRVAEAGRVLNLENRRIELTFLAISQIASKGILCLDVDTKILARRGWLFWHELRRGEDVAGFDLETGKIAWQPLIDVYEFAFGGEAVAATHAGSTVSMIPYHRVVVEDGSAFTVKRARHLDGSEKWPLFDPGSALPNTARLGEIEKVQTVQWEGRVWCPETPTTTWIARKGDFLFVTGNTLEELRRQLGDQIPGIVPAVAAAMGETTASFLSMVKAGDILAEDALPAIARALKNLTGSEVQAAALTLAANIGRLQTSAQLAQKRIIELNDEALNGFIVRLDEIIQASPKTEAAIAAMVGDLILMGEELLRIAPAGIEVARILTGSLVVAFKTITETVELAISPLKGFIGTLLALKELATTGEFLGFDFEGVKISAEEVATAIELVNERLLEAQGKNAEEAARIAQDEADRRIKIFELLVAKIEREEAELGLNLQEIAKKRSRLREDLAKNSSSELLAIERQLNREVTRLTLEAAEDQAAAFDSIVSAARAAGDQRVADSAVSSAKLEALEVELAKNIGSALEQHLAKTKLTGEQRLEAQQELHEKLVELEAETIDKIAAVQEEFNESIREGTDREEAEKEASEKVIKIYEAELEKRIDLTEKAVEKVIKLEERRVARLEKLERKLTEAILKEEETKRKAREATDKAFQDLNKAFPDFTLPQVDTSEIAKLQDELGRLQLSGAGADQLREAAQRIADLRRGVSSAGDSFDALGESAKAAGTLLGLVNTEGFRSQFAALDETTQSFLRTQIEGFQEAARLGNINRQTISALQGDFAIAGIAAEESFGRSSTAVDGLTSALDRLGEGSKSSRGLQDLTEEVAALAGGVQQAVVPMEGVAVAAGQIAENAPAAGEGLANMGSALSEHQPALESASASFDKLAVSLPAIQDGTADLVNTIPALLSSIDEAVENGTLEGFSGAIDKIATTLAAAEPGLAAVPPFADAILKAAAEADGIKELAEGVKTLSKGAAGMQKLADASETLSTKLQEVQKAIQELGADDGGVELFRTKLSELKDLIEGEFKTALASLKTELGAVKAAVGELESAIGQLQDAFQSLGNQASAIIGDIRSQLKAATGDAKDLAVALRDVKVAADAAAA